MSELKHRITQRLEQMFQFKVRGEWFREGVCPQCSKKELYTHATNPRIVKCGRLTKAAMASICMTQTLQMPYLKTLKSDVDQSARTKKSPQSSGHIFIH